jgi:hypothetical protein
VPRTEGTRIDEVGRSSPSVTSATTTTALQSSNTLRFDAGDLIEAKGLPAEL